MKDLSITVVLLMLLSITAATYASDPVWLDQILANKNYLIAGALITAIACVRYLLISRRHRRRNPPKELRPPDPRLPRLTQELSMSLASQEPNQLTHRQDTAAKARAAKELWSKRIPPDDDS